MSVLKTTSVLQAHNSNQFKSVKISILLGFVYKIFTLLLQKLECTISWGINNPEKIINDETKFFYKRKEFCHNNTYQ